MVAVWSLCMVSPRSLSATSDGGDEINLNYTTELFARLKGEQARGTNSGRVCLKRTIDSICVTLDSCVVAEETAACDLKNLEVGQFTIVKDPDTGRWLIQDPGQSAALNQKWALTIANGLWPLRYASFGRFDPNQTGPGGSVVLEERALDDAFFSFKHKGIYYMWRLQGDKLAMIYFTNHDDALQASLRHMFVEGEKEISKYVEKAPEGNVFIALTAFEMATPGKTGTQEPDSDKTRTSPEVNDLRE